MHRNIPGLVPRFADRAEVLFLKDYESWAAVVVAWESAAERTEMILPRSRPRVGGEEIDCRNQGTVERIHDKGPIERASRRAGQCIRTR